MPKSQMAQVRALIQRNNLMPGWLGKLRRQNHHVLQPTSYFPPTTHQKKQPTNAVYAIAFSSITTEKKIMESILSILKSRNIQLTITSGWF